MKALFKTVVLASVLVLFVGVSIGQAQTHIYIDQAVGVNSQDTTGAANDPFKSITFAFLVMNGKGAADPWVVHVKAGTYDADPGKPVTEQESFPIELRDGMTLQGEDGAENCIISGAYPQESSAALVRGVDVENITIKDLTLRDMNRTTGQGAACELIRCWGVVQGCLFLNNANNEWDYDNNHDPAIIRLSVTEGRDFSIVGNNFNGNNANDEYGWAISVETNMVGDLANNEIIDHGYNGIRIAGKMTGDVTGNTISECMVESLWIDELIGNIANNTFSNNKLSPDGEGGGVDIDAMTGSITGNTSSQSGRFLIGDLTGNISDNQFINNATNYGDGTVSIYTLNGNISSNIFSGNSSITGGAIKVYNLNGNILSNSFTDNFVADWNLDYNTWEANVGGAVYIDNPKSVEISKNVFANNAAYAGGAIWVGDSTENNNSVMISNNFFLHNSVHETLNGAAVYSEHGIDFINNTVYGVFDDTHPQGVDSMVNILDPNSVVRNNIFSFASSAVLVAGDVLPMIDHNNFYMSTNALHLNSQPKGNNLEYLNMQYPNNFKDNYDWQPGVKADASGVYTSDIDDYHLVETSDNINAGVIDERVATDYDGDIRPQGATHDIGADELAVPNKVPEAQDQSVATDEDVAKSITLVGTDGDKDPLTYSIESQPAHGDLTGDPPNLTYTPELNYFGSDSFTFKVSDGKAVSNLATVAITVNPVNDPPTATHQTRTFTAVEIDMSGADVESDPLTYSVTTPPANGTLTGQAPSFIYIPKPDYTGDDSFQFVANDGTDNSETVTVNISVSGSGSGCAVVFDIGDDCKKGLEEAIDALRGAAGVQ